MTHPAFLCDLYGQTYDVIRRQTAGLTHEDSLLQPSHGGNCLNWVVGHITIARANILALLGEQPAWDWRASRLDAQRMTIAQRRRRRVMTHPSPGAKRTAGR